MQCPYCNEEMKKGYIQSPRHKIYWGKKKSDGLLITPSDNDVILSKGILKMQNTKI